MTWHRIFFIRLNGCRSITPDLFKHFKCMGVCLCKTFHCSMIVNLVHLLPRPLRVVRIKISPSLLSLQEFVTDFTRQRLANGDRSANRLTLQICSSKESWLRSWVQIPPPGPFRYPILVYSIYDSTEVAIQNKKQKRNGEELICLSYTTMQTKFILFLFIQLRMLSETLIIIRLKVDNSAASVVPRFTLFMLPSAVACLPKNVFLKCNLKCLPSDSCSLTLCVNVSPVPSHVTWIVIWASSMTLPNSSNSKTCIVTGESEALSNFLSVSKTFWSVFVQPSKWCMTFSSSVSSTTQINVMPSRPSITVKSANTTVPNSSISTLMSFHWVKAVSPWPPFYYFLLTRSCVCCWCCSHKRCIW